MDETKVVRATAIAGVLFVILIIVQGPVLNSNSPSLTDSAQKIFNSFSKHQGNIKAAAVVYGFAMSAVLIWFSGLFRVLRKAEGGQAGLAVAALGGVTLAAAMSLVNAAIDATTALRVHDLGPSGARFFFTLESFAGAGILFGLLVVIAATAAVCLRTGLFARWFTVVSGLLVVVSIVGAAGIGYANSSIQTVGAVALSLDTLWVLVVSVWLWRKPELALP